ncbi:expressed unknown protein [Seminavis robusta]|uniref:Uncharacterized protein n=1 Tax=Seminavis robusta TaxID=568900 RepID=A0A9N8DKB1_9STRA|nr:expressed unknown protein [Seminavis robusta]|eukprot:Sro168_g074810.1 n/a (206) ;mRNA; f:42859-43735
MHGSEIRTLSQNSTNKAVVSFCSTVVGGGGGGTAATMHLAPIASTSAKISTSASSIDNGRTNLQKHRKGHRHHTAESAEVTTREVRPDKRTERSVFARGKENDAATTEMLRSKIVELEEEGEKLLKWCTQQKKKIEEQSDEVQRLNSLVAPLGEENRSLKEELEGPYYTRIIDQAKRLLDENEKQDEEIQRLTNAAGASSEYARF